MDVPAEIVLIISGRVQKVGFRYKVKRLADHHSLTGYTQNLADGNVMVLAQGPKHTLEALVTDISSLGPPVSVRDFNISWRKAITPYVEFQVRK